MEGSGFICPECYAQFGDPEALMYDHRRSGLSAKFETPFINIVCIYSSKNSLRSSNHKFCAFLKIRAWMGPWVLDV